jgi:demethylmenaquinone methyltransferase/2-methoxy-6-polyprenyl-1,4-benzoquinol methylase
MFAAMAKYDQQEPKTHFGFRSVEAAQKPSLVRGVFESVAPRYDLMNDLMSGGIHRLWKSTLVDLLNPRPGLKLLDVAGGTGDVSLRVLERLTRKTDGGGGPAARVTVCDFTPEMLRIGYDRATDKGFVGNIDWVCGDAQALPFADRSSNAYTIAFGLRNMTDIDRALAEAYRVLRPGGRFLCLEFSRIVLPLLDKLYDRYSFGVLPAIGAAVTGDREAYEYLVESIRRFPDQKELQSRIEGVGFARASYRNLSSGIAAIHSGWRI